MFENDQDKSTYRLAGYAVLIERYGLDVIPNWHKSLVTASGIHRIDSSGDIIGDCQDSCRLNTTTILTHRAEDTSQTGADLGQYVLYSRPRYRHS